MDKIEAWIITIAIALTILAIPTKLFRLMVLTLICTSCTAMVWGAERSYPDEEIAEQMPPTREIAAVDALNHKCRGGGHDLASMDRICAARDAAYANIVAKGWCWGHDSQIEADKQWERCRIRREIPGAGSVFLMVEPIVDRQRQEECQALAAAGNPSASRYCKVRSDKARNYLEDHARHSVLPDIGWRVCIRQIEYSFELGARCIAAGESIAKIDASGNIIDQTSFILVMTSGAWMANPDAIALDLN